ncbi:MAG: hypothetical protein V4850_32270 [Myxococcota bacterium]
MVVFLRPVGGDREVVGRGRVNASTERTAYERAIRQSAPGLHEVRQDLRDSANFVDALLSRCGADCSGLASSIQIGFADLLSFGADPDEGDSAQQELRDAYEALRRAETGGEEARARAYFRVDACTRAVCADLLVDLEGLRLPRPLVYLQTSLEHSPLDLPARHCLVGMRYLADEARRTAAMAASVRMRSSLMTGVAASAVIGMLGATFGLMGWAFWKPETLGGLAQAACASLGASGFGRCGCLPIAAAELHVDQPLAERVASLRPHVAECADDRGTSERISLALGEALLEPARFCSEVLPAVTWRSADRTRLGAPLITGSERAFGGWLLDAVRGQPGDVPTVRAALSDSGWYPEVVARILGAELARGCLSAWREAREQPERWPEAHATCRDQPVWVALAPDLRARFAADTPPFVDEPGRAVLRWEVDLPSNAVCPQGRTFDEVVVGSAPPIDWRTATNLAALSTVPGGHAAWARLATGAPAGVRDWLAVSDPALTADEQVARLREADIVALQTLFSQAWVVVETGEERPRGNPGRVAEAPRLRTANATALGCSLVPPLLAESPVLAPVADNSAALATVAHALLTARPEPLDPEWLACVASAELALLHAEPGRPVDTLHARLTALARTEGPHRGAAVLLACHTAAEIGAQDALLGQMGHLTSIDRTAAERCVVRASLVLAADGQTERLEVVLQAAPLSGPRMGQLRTAALAVQLCRGAAPPTSAAVWGAASSGPSREELRAEVAMASAPLAQIYRGPDLARHFERLRTACD